MWATSWIRRFIPKTAYERESLVKGFLLFFLSMEFFLVLTGYLYYAKGVVDLRSSIFLELKNFSYTFEGERFRIDLVSGEDLTFYELFEDREGLYILVPVPVAEGEAIKIIYPRELYEEDLWSLRRETLALLSLSTLVALVLSTGFSLYAVHPLRRAINMIEEVTRDIIHDLNTPVMTLMVNLKMIGKKYRGEELERAMIALKQITSLQENLKPLLVKVELKMEEIDAGKIVSEEVETFRSLYPEMEVSVRAEPVKLRADREAFRRIVENLLSNAFKHNVKGGWVKVDLNKSRLLVENSSKPLKNPSKVFERYYRESQRGLGLGLSIVKKLSEEMGWEVDHSYRNGVFTVKVTFR
ncbi:MAG: HAMP domain-containing sensor histidine kinase [Aquificota bacterium]|nr:HAMP domain-containing sensor histidine kinase [Aquificota bacterium]